MQFSFFCRALFVVGFVGFFKPFEPLELLMLRECAEYGFADDACLRVANRLAPIVLTRRNIEQHYQAVCEDCLLELPPHFLEVAELPSEQFRFLVFRRFAVYRTDVGEQERHNILLSSIRGARADDVKALMRICDVQKEEIIEVLLGELERERQEKQALRSRLEQLERLCLQCSTHSLYHGTLSQSQDGQNHRRKDGRWAARPRTVGGGTAKG